MAFSMTLTCPFSQGLMVMRRGSGTDTVAIWLTGVSTP